MSQLIIMTRNYKLIQILMKNIKLNTISNDNMKINIKETILQYLVYWKWFVLFMNILYVRINIPLSTANVNAIKGRRH